MGSVSDGPHDRRFTGAGCFGPKGRGLAEGAPRDARKGKDASHSAGRGAVSGPCAVLVDGVDQGDWVDTVECVKAPGLPHSVYLVHCVH